MKRGPDLLPRRPWTEADNEQLRALMAEGRSRREVAAALARSENAVRLQCRKLGLRFDETRARDRMRSAVAKAWTSPGYRERVGAKISASWTPERRAAQAVAARDRRLWTFGHAVLAEGGEARARQRCAAAAALRALRRKALAWCPLEYRDDYRLLKTAGGYSAADARRLIEQQIDRDLRRYASTRRLPQAARMRTAALQASSKGRRS